MYIAIGKAGSLILNSVTVSFSVTTSQREDGLVRSFDNLSDLAIYYEDLSKDVIFNRGGIKDAFNRRSIKLIQSISKSTKTVDDEFNTLKGLVKKLVQFRCLHMYR